MGETTIRVRVTQEDIDAGVRGDCDTCPVALATARALPRKMVAYVWSTGMTIRALPNFDFVTDHEFSSEIIDWIREFDAGSPMTPFDFDLSLPAMESANG